MPTLIQLKNAGYNVDELSFSLSIDSPKNTSKTIKALAEVNKDILFIHEKDEELDLFLNKMINEFEPALRSAALKHKRPASSLLGGDQSFKKMRAF